ncbi:hypothetical protein P1X15_27215 [Runella sp. MFBS21]|uniref:hypothetical protein n=1 Tax=Runella sp. MFBS21 TaxID=3034018 RepID=UPI0023F9008B|nr:hypothetical protein [Runella sp. MFBS21]MDF7821344.1 hypothetical protein [Runella sp. MFBS21]
MKITIKRTWWGQLAVIGLIVTAVWISLVSDSIFNTSPTPFILLLPFVWGCFKGNFHILDSDPALITPKNIMLLIWFHKFIVIPIELLLVGNKILPTYYDNQTILTEVSIYIVSFVSFLWGWEFKSKGIKIPTFHSPNLTNTLIFIYLTISITSLIILYGSLQKYIEGSFFSYVTQEILEHHSGSPLGLIANLGQKFWPFGIMLLWYKTTPTSRPQPSLFTFVFWLPLCMMGILSSNRSNMLYPLLAFMSILGAQWKVRYKWKILLVIELGILILFFFGYIRVQPFLDFQSIETLFKHYVEDTDYVWFAHQLYLGSPYQITPLLHIPPPSSTLLASLLDPVPVMGKDFREQSGPYIYNLSFHNYTYVSQDKVIPVAGELFFNGGYLLVFVGHFIFGRGCRWLNHAFQQTLSINPIVSACFFYLMLLFSATLLLSLSVLVQFFLYNALPALLIIAVNWLQIRKAS